MTSRCWPVRPRRRSLPQTHPSRSRSSPRSLRLSMRASPNRSSGDCPLPRRSGIPSTSTAVMADPISPAATGDRRSRKASGGRSNPGPSTCVSRHWRSRRDQTKPRLRRQHCHPPTRLGVGLRRPLGRDRDPHAAGADEAHRLRLRSRCPARPPTPSWHRRSARTWHRRSARTWLALRSRDPSEDLPPSFRARRRHADVREQESRTPSKGGGSEICVSARASVRSERLASCVVAHSGPFLVRRYDRCGAPHGAARRQIARLLDAVRYPARRRDRSRRGRHVCRRGYQRRCTAGGRSSPGAGGDGPHPRAGGVAPAG
jgi:hypothetical protein